MPGYTLLAKANRVASEENLAPRQTYPPIYQPQNPPQYYAPQQPHTQYPVNQMTYGSPSQDLAPNQQILIKSAPATPLLNAPIKIIETPALPYDRTEALMKQNQSDYFFKPYPEPVPQASVNSKHAQYSPDCLRLCKCLTLKLPQLKQNRPQLRIVMEGPIIQLGLRKPIEKKRYLFVCDDFMLLCKKMGFGKFMPKWFIPLNRRKAFEDIVDSMYKIPGVEFRVYAPKRDFTFFAASPQEKDVWIQTMNNQLAIVLERERQRDFAKLPKEDFIWFDQIGKPGKK